MGMTEILKIGSFIHEKTSPILPTYPDIAEKGSALPFCIYSITGYFGRDTKDRYNYEESVGVAIDVAAATGAERTELASRIKQTLEGFRGVWRGNRINAVTLNGASTQYGQDAYLMRLNFTITVENTITR